MCQAGSWSRRKEGKSNSEKNSTAVLSKSWGISRGRVRGGYDADVTGSSGVAEKGEQAEKIGRDSGNLWCDSAGRRDFEGWREGGC